MKHAHYLPREEEGGEGDQRGGREADVVAHAHDPVYGLGVAAAVILRHQHSGAALDAEDDEAHHIEEAVGAGDGGQLHLAQGAHHEGVRQGHEIRHEVLQDEGQHEEQRVAVKAPLLPQAVRYHSVLRASTGLRRAAKREGMRPAM